MDIWYYPKSLVSKDMEEWIDTAIRNGIVDKNGMVIENFIQSFMNDMNYEPWYKKWFIKYFVGIAVPVVSVLAGIVTIIKVFL